MSGLPPTPLSEHKRMLRSHSKAPEFNSVEEEDKSSSEEEEEHMQYDLVEEGDIMEVPSESERAAGRDKQSEHKAFKATDSSDDTPCSTMLTMSISSANGTITMTAADLLVFCQQMMMTTHQNSDSNDSGTSANDLKQEICEYQKEVQTSMNMKTITTFNETNYQA
ncbi:hypothetical protein EMCG_06174 [[Emmonsia] crescens]|uniref:Uncharacterized protein n=1 Tax=[Emmonsia] crescens TaxID=73230 RepID=A0A0G2IBW7_9EURO|nr:hypothetical protein EMCG_06174 [Emmonsia crescens UAMH 3008]